MITLDEMDGGGAARVDGGREYRRVFLTRGPGPAESHLAAPGLPRKGDADLVHDVYAVCRGLAKPPEPVPGGYRLTYVYAIAPPAEPPADRPRSG